MAGSSQRTSQKIHSQKHGAAEAAAAARFVLFLDDDVWVHPGTVRRLVAAMEARPEARDRGRGGLAPPLRSGYLTRSRLRFVAHQFEHRLARGRALPFELHMASLPRPAGADGDGVPIRPAARKRDVLVILCDGGCFSLFRVACVPYASIPRRKCDAAMCAVFICAGVPPAAHRRVLTGARSPQLETPNSVNRTPNSVHRGRQSQSSFQTPLSNLPQGTVTKNVWGGCMMLRASTVRSEGPGGIGTAWGAGDADSHLHARVLLPHRLAEAGFGRFHMRALIAGDGAYSDDLILASLAGSRGQSVPHPPSCFPSHALPQTRLPQKQQPNHLPLSLRPAAPILCPAEAVFPNQLSGRTGRRDWWNYLHRQLYVLDTYMFPHNRRACVVLIVCCLLSVRCGGPVSFGGGLLVVPVVPVNERGSETTADDSAGD